jgi:predicted amidophosphoribosyltransferase
LLRLSRVPVCTTCSADLPQQSGPLCLCCGEALGAHAFAGADRAPGDWLCRPCRVSPPRFERAIAYSLYRDTMRALLHLLKYEGMEPVARSLGEKLAALVVAQPALPQDLVVVPVPLFGAKYRQRGYNQAELLARAVVQAGKHQGLAWKLDAHLLRRTRATQSQAGLTPRQRRANVRGAFFVPGSRRDPASGPKRGNGPTPMSGLTPASRATPELKRLQGKDILLIDDIYTTGATARAASIALSEAGAASVWVATAARAQRFDTVPAPELPMQQDVAFWN